MFKSILDQESIYKKLGRQQVYSSILGLKNQVDQAWTEVSHSSLKSELVGIKDICVCGMGGSALGGRIIRSLDQYILNLPLEVITNYRLPNYVDKNTLVVLSSYSGNTEETLSCAHDALARRAKIFIVTSGGKLLDYAKQHQLDHYQIEPRANPSHQPRLGLGYSIIAVFAVLARCGFINFGAKDVEAIKVLLEKLNQNFRKETPFEHNPAKLLAEKLRDWAVVLISANHLSGTVHAVKNMLNENSKVFATQFDLPELCHHFLEGLSYPKDLKNQVHFVLLNSDHYPKAIQHRLTISRQILDKHGFATTLIKPEADHPTLQAFEVLAFGAFLSFYLAVLYRLDPGPIPSVDYLKTALAKI